MNVQELSVEAYDALVDAGQIVAWGGQEARRLSREIQSARSMRTTDGRKHRANPGSGDLAEACRKILAYKLKRPPSRKPRSAGLRSAGSAWDA